MRWFVIALALASGSPALAQFPTHSREEYARAGQAHAAYPSSWRRSNIANPYPYIQAISDRCERLGLGKSYGARQCFCVGFGITRVDVEAIPVSEMRKVANLCRIYIENVPPDSDVPIAE